MLLEAFTIYSESEIGFGFFQEAKKQDQWRLNDTLDRVDSSIFIRPVVIESSIKRFSRFIWVPEIFCRAAVVS